MQTNRSYRPIKKRRTSSKELRQSKNVKKIITRFRITFCRFLRKHSRFILKTICLELYHNIILLFIQSVCSIFYDRQYMFGKRLV
jgi:hypothetical protein